MAKAGLIRPRWLFGSWEFLRFNVKISKGNIIPLICHPPTPSLPAAGQEENSIMRVKYLVCSIAIVCLAGCSSDDPLNTVENEGTTETPVAGDVSVEPTPDAEVDTFEPDTWIEDAMVEDTIDGDTPDTIDLPDVAEDIAESPDVEMPPEEDPIPEPEITPDFSQCSEPGGKMNIYDIQNPQCPDHFDPEPTEAPGAYIFLEGVVVTGIFSDTIFVQEVPGGPYSGISVYLGALFGGDLSRGDVLNLEGYYYEYFGNTQLTVEEMTLVDQMQPLAPFEVLHPSHVATDGPIAEWFEGVLVTVKDVKTINTKPDCPNDFNEFLVTGELRVDDMGFLWDAKLGDAFSSITGPLHFAFENHKIEPRDEQDIQWLGKGDANSVSKCTEGDCQVPETVLGTHDIVINEIMADPWKQDTGKEWIELFNPTNGPIDVYGWEIRDCADQKFKLTGPDLVIPAGGYLVVGGSMDDTVNGGVSVDVSYGDGFYLPNTVGSVLLFNGPGPTATLQDQARYMVFQEWDWFETGKSIERISPDSDGTLATSWKLANAPYGSGDNFGTPGF